jgi:hypothetical protein
MQVFPLYYADRPPQTKINPYYSYWVNISIPQKCPSILKRKVILVLWFKLPLMISHAIISCHF